jgi:hypothetical protein
MPPDVVSSIDVYLYPFKRWSLAVAVWMLSSFAFNVMPNVGSAIQILFNQIPHKT